MKKSDFVIEAVRYKNGKIDVVRGYQRRGPTYTDRILLDRKTLLERLKEGKLVVIGYDSGQQQMDAIRSGAEFGAVTQDPIGIGYKCVQAAVDALAGKTLPKTIDTGFHWYDKSNIDDPTIAALLYK